MQKCFPGLDSLRFLAAMFVVIYHIPTNQKGTGLPSWHWGGFFDRGESAVLFFFTLSGFLITFLLLAEQRSRGCISVKAFYVRRILRIWTLYFLIVSFGLCFYLVLMPAFGMTRVIEYNTIRPLGYRLSTAVALYGLFLPNLMTSLYSMGGILNVTWSIGVEEQYYLSWAPIVARARGRILGILVVVFVLFLALSVWAHYHQQGLGRFAIFVGSLNFHFMATGGLLAYAAFHHRERLFALAPLRWRALRWVMLLLLMQFYLVGWFPKTWLSTQVIQLVLYPMLLAEVALQERPIFRLTSHWVERLGEASYGIYMYHMVVVYLVSFLFLKTLWWRNSPFAYMISYYVLAIGGTIVVSLLSYRYFEQPFLRLKGQFTSRGAKGLVGSLPLPNFES